MIVYYVIIMVLLKRSFVKSKVNFRSSIKACMMETISRRKFLKKTTGLAASTIITGSLISLKSSKAAVKTTQINAEGFFTIGQRNGRWWFITPEGKPFFSIGLNHIDSATLRYIENAHIWWEKYANSMEKWLKKVRSDLLRWGFNTVGWVQEVVTRDDLKTN